MEVRWSILLTIIGASIVTLVPRVLPLLVLSRKPLPDWAMRWLNYIPIAIMAALVGQEVFVPNGELAPLKSNVYLFAAIPTFAAALLTRSLLGTVGVGVIALMVLRLLY